MGFPVLAAQFLTCCHLRAGPCLSSRLLSSLPACEHTAHRGRGPRFTPCQPSGFTPPLTCLCPPAFGCAPRLLPVLGPVQGTSPWMSLEGEDFHASPGSTSAHRHLQQPGAVFGHGSCRGQGGSGDVRGATGGQDPPVPALPVLPRPGCVSPPVFLDPSVCAVLCPRFPARGFQDVWMRCRDGSGVCLPSNFPHPA